MELKGRKLKAVKIWGAITLFTLCFGAVYEYFSFGVYSYYMIYAFIFPMLMTLYNIAVKDKNEMTDTLFAASAATFTLGFIFKGVVEIYGSSSSLTVIYWGAGTVLALAGIASAVIRFGGSSLQEDKITD